MTPTSGMKLYILWILGVRWIMNEELRALCQLLQMRETDGTVRYVDACMSIKLLPWCACHCHDGVRYRVGKQYMRRLHAFHWPRLAQVSGGFLLRKAISHCSSCSALALRARSPPPIVLLPQFLRPLSLTGFQVSGQKSPTTHYCDR